MIWKREIKPLPEVINGKIKITDSLVIEKGLIKIIKKMKDVQTAKMSYFLFNAENVKIYAIPIDECPYTIEQLQQII